MRSIWPATAAARSAHGAEPRVVAALEPLQELDEQLHAIELAAGLDEQRRGRTVDVLRERLRLDVHVDAGPEDDPPLTSLGQDPCNLSPADEHVVRELQRRVEPRRRADRLGARVGSEPRQLGEPPARRVWAKLERAEQARSGGSQPAAPEATAPGRLLVGDDERAL